MKGYEEEVVQAAVEAIKEGRLRPVEEVIEDLNLSSRIDWGFLIEQFRRCWRNYRRGYAGALWTFSGIVLGMVDGALGVNRDPAEAGRLIDRIVRRSLR